MTDADLLTWIGFVYTRPEEREGKRTGKQLR